MASWNLDLIQSLPVIAPPHLGSPLCFQDSAPGVPIFVFLSPGVDVAASVEALGKKLGFTGDAGEELVRQPLISVYGLSLLSL
jgi:hypothetical protein